MPVVNYTKRPKPKIETQSTNGYKNKTEKDSDKMHTVTYIMNGSNCLKKFENILYPAVKGQKIYIEGIIDEFLVMDIVDRISSNEIKRVIECV